jgi:glutathione synthase/RimK-type ligase-like ATP-grasp enzyme
MKQFDIVLLTESRYVNPANPDWYARQILEDDALLTVELEKFGLRVTRKDWADPDFDWGSTRMAIFRTTWDYFNRFAEFRDWLAMVEQRTKLVNPPALIRWNWDKHYLRDLNQRDIHIPETLFIETGTEESLLGIHARTGWTETVLKPAIAGAARHTYRLNENNLEAHEDIFHELTRNEAMLLQPFQRNVVEQGEISLMVIGGKFTHAVLKRAKAGDFRVQDDFGGTASAYKPTEEEIRFAEQAVTACDIAPIYARADIIRDNNGKLALTELELIEPELWLRHNPLAARLMAREIAAHL